MIADFKAASLSITLCLLFGGCAASNKSSAFPVPTQPFQYANQSNDLLALTDGKMSKSAQPNPSETPDPKRIGPWVTTKAPRVIVAPLPIYPFFAENQKVNVTVLVGFIVTTKGEVTDAKVIDSSDHRFDDYALNAVRGWQFWPAVEMGKPVEFPIRVPIVFKN